LWTQQRRIGLVLGIGEEIAGDHSVVIEDAKTLAANTGRSTGDDGWIHTSLNDAREQLRLRHPLDHASEDQMKDLLETVDPIGDGTKTKGAGTDPSDRIRNLLERANKSSQPQPHATSRAQP
jgi:hypothetical protein